MTKHRKTSAKKSKKLFIIVLVILLAILAVSVLGYFLYSNFFANKTHTYLLENKYYGLKLQAPANWVAEEKTLYPEDNIAKILTECRADRLVGAPAREIGAFRFRSSKYPDNSTGNGYTIVGFPSGTILEITIGCISDSTKNKTGNYPGDITIAGENAMEDFLDSPDFGKIKQLYLFHNNLQYKISEYIYISPSDKKNEAKLRLNYAETFNKIISSFSFTK